MPISVLSQIEELASRLSARERLLLIERLASALRQDSETEPARRDQPLTVPAAEPSPPLAPPMDQDDRIITDTPAARRAREAEYQQAQLTVAWNEAMRQLGISGAPIGAEELQKRIAASGVNPEDNEFSRGIIEMREE